MEKENTAIRLNRIMTERGLRQVDVLNLTIPYCQKYNVKMNKSAISQYCSGKTEPMQDKLFVLGAALGINEAWLMGYNVPMERNNYEDQTILTREAILKEIENILSKEKYTLLCEDYYSDYFVIKNSCGHTITSLYDYELIPGYEKLRKNSNVSADSIIALKSSHIKPHEMNLIEKYRALDTLGQNAVDWILDHETARVAALSERDNRIKIMETEQSRRSIPRRIFAYYGKIAATGTWVDFSDLIAGTKEYYLTEENANADYTIGVNGDSMEPTYYDGDIVFVKSANHLNVGDIGIFQKNNSIYIKEVGENGLISHNAEKYSPMVDDGDVRCWGKVVGKVTEDMVITD